MKTITTPIIISIMLLSSNIAFANIDKNRFANLDKNRDGVLSKHEVESQPEVIRFTNLFGNDSFRLADINKDGLLDFEEYQANEEDIY